MTVKKDTTIGGKVVTVTGKNIKHSIQVIYEKRCVDATYLIGLHDNTIILLCLDDNTGHYLTVPPDRLEEVLFQLVRDEAFDASQLKRDKYRNITIDTQTLYGTDPYQLIIAIFGKESSELPYIDKRSDIIDLCETYVPTARLTAHTLSDMLSLGKSLVIYMKENPVGVNGGKPSDVAIYAIGLLRLCDITARLSHLSKMTAREIIERDLGEVK